MRLWIYAAAILFAFSPCSPARLSRALDAASNPRIRNVLFIVSDDLKASVLGCYGDPYCKTPNLDRLARESTLFSRAFCQGVVCGPSRQSFMFSRYRGRAAINLGQAFREAGWYSGRVGKIYHMRVPGDIIAGTNGDDVANSWTERFNSPGPETHSPGEYACLNLNIFTRDMENRQSTQMPHRMFVTVQTDSDGTEQADYKSASKAIELLEEHAANPFFLAVGLVRPHYPMVAPKPYFDPYPWQQLPLPETVADDLKDIPKLGLASTLSSKNPIGNYPDNQRRMWSGYYASVAFMDAQVGRIIDALENLGLRESTAIVFTSDHGYHLGEHGFWQKANLHDEIIRVPLLISVPGMKPARCDSIVELVDIFPTLCELGGLSTPESVQGKSIVPLLRDPELSIKESALSFDSHGTSLRTQTRHFIQYRDGTQELYDLRQDPKEFYNLAEQAEYATEIRQQTEMLRNRLLEIGIQ